MKTLEELTEENVRLKKILNHIYSEKTGSYFICGEAGPKDSTGLPDKIMICPTYGLDWFVVYQKTEKSYGNEG